MGWKGTYLCLLMLMAMGFVLKECSPQTGRRLLSLLFDGVPPVDSLQLQVQANSLMNTDELASGEAVTEEQLSSLVIHYPYEVRACDICHDPNSLGKMVEPEPGLCYICHDDYKNRYPWLHGPVAGGYCTSCHDPHTSKQAKLLKFTGHALCYFCHREEDVLKSELHTDLGEMACTDCHNPHGGEDHLILY